MADAYRNFAAATVAVPPSPATTGTSLTLQAGGAGRYPPVPFNCTVWPQGVLPMPSNAEVIRVTAITGDTFTILRAQEGSTARAIVANDVVAATITAGMVDSFYNASELNAGTVPDARLSALVARANVQNRFQTSQIISGSATSMGTLEPGDLLVSRGDDSGVIYFGNPAQRYLYWYTGDGSFRLVGGPLQIANGGVRDYNRAVAMGDWTDVPFGAINFGGLTLTGAAVLTNAYTIVGHTLYWKLMIASSATANGNQPYFTFNLPVAMTSSWNQGGALGGFYCSTLGHSVGQWRLAAGTNYVQVLFTNLAQLPSGAAIELWCDFTIRMP